MIATLAITAYCTVRGVYCRSRSIRLDIKAGDAGMWQGSYKEDPKYNIKSNDYSMRRK